MISCKSAEVGCDMLALSNDQCGLPPAMLMCVLSDSKRVRTVETGQRKKSS